MQWQFLLTLNGHSMLQGCIFALTDWKIWPSVLGTVRGTRSAQGIAGRITNVLWFNWHLDM